MKNYRTILFAALVAIPFAAACNKENEEPGISPDGESGLVSLTLSASGEADAEDEGDASSKVTFDDTNNARWENSDHVAVFDGSGKRNFSMMAGTNTGATAYFEGSVSSGYSNLYTVYPYSAANSLSGSNVSVTVPSVQTVPSGNHVDPSAIVSVGKVNLSNKSVEFKQVCGLVSFVVNTTDIYKVIITGTNLAGTATIVPTTGAITGSVTSGADKIEVGYSGGGNFPKGKYYAAVLPGTSAAGEFSVAFVHADGVTHRRSVSSAVTIARKGRKAAGTVTVENPKIRHIYNKAQLDAWGEGMVDDEQYFTVYLDADIDYQSGIWSYSNTHFNGNFIGQNHKIYNIIVESGTTTAFIYELWGQFKDVVFGSSNGSSWDGVSRITHKGTAGAVEYVGLIGKMQADASLMRNVTSYAPVSVPSGYNTRAFLGGLVGFIAANKTVTMTNCKNYGSVSNSSSWTGDPMRMGGIVGQCNGALTATGIENHGALTVNSAKATFVGGISGDLGAGSVISGASNYGSISFTDSGTSDTYIGGCFGTVRGSTLSSCHNYAAHTVTRNAKQWFGGIAGLMESGESTLTDCVNHSGADLEVASSVTTKSVRMGGMTGGCSYNGSGPFKIIIQDCSNNAAITNNGCGTHFAGIAGLFDNYYASATIVIQNCENTGAVASKVADNALSVAEELRVGGILGMCDPEDSGAEQTVQSCVNLGAVSVKGALKSGASLRVGGIVGHAYYGILIDRCKNLAPVSCEGAGGDAGGAVFNLGGILGYVNKRSSSNYQKVTNCINTGAVSTIRNYSNHYIGGIIGGGTNADTYPVVSGCKNFGNISSTRTENTLVGGLCGYSRWNVSNSSNFGNVTGGSWNGAIVGDGNANAVMTTGLKVGVDVNVTGAANAGTKYTGGKKTYSYTTTLTAEKKWFSGWSDAPITVTVGDQESYSGGTSPEEAGTGGYLFAHTGHGDGYYYRMFYALSHDGLSWTEINGGASPMPTYYGFPYVTQDSEGTFWLIGVSNSTPRHPIVWKSTDMVSWTVVKEIPTSVMALPSGYENDTNSYGAVKIFSDPVSGRFMLTWHAGESGKSGDDYWESMRTFYVLTSDFETFTTAQKLFNFTGSDANVAQIDANIHYSDGKYYAVFKDERTYESSKTYYKRPRIASSNSLNTGYGNPGGGLTGKRREAPTLVKSPDGVYWYLYTEYYDSDPEVHTYELYRSTSLTTSGWTQVTAFTPPTTSTICRHGCVIPIDAKVYRRLNTAYGN